jgi:hypothetical protein
MINTIKRLFSCFSILLICIMTNMGLEAKAVSVPYIKSKSLFTHKSTTNVQQNAFTLYNGSSLINSKNDKLADHYSHYSHESHQSHYSSSY